jgi:hypothetical protein
MEPRLGVVLHDGDAGVEALLSAFVGSLRADGADVGGLLQRTGRQPNGRPRMELVDIRHGGVFLISQDLGRDSTACCVDPSGVAAAALVLKRELAAPPALLVVNKFAGLEAKGGGLLAELFEAVAGGVPVLTSLARRHQPAWEAAVQGAGTVLPPDAAALLAWWRSITGGATSAPDAPSPPPY